MGIGVLLGYVIPQTGPMINSFQIDSVSLPIAVGLIWMMYPPLAAVNYGAIGKVKKAKKMMSHITCPELDCWAIPNVRIGMDISP